MSDHPVINVYDGGVLNYNSSQKDSVSETGSKRSSGLSRIPFKTILAGVGLCYVIGVSQNPKENFNFFENVGVGVETSYNLAAPGIRRAYGALEAKFLESVDEYGPKLIEASSDVIDETSDSIKVWYKENSI